MKKKLLLVLLTVALIIGTFSAFAIMTGAQTTEPEMKIAYCNLSFRDNVCIKYAVKSDASDVKILIWTSPDSEYTVGTHDDEITEYYTEDIGGVSHMIFDYTKLTAKQMTDVVYARVYAKVDGIDHYSEVNKYSILQYAYNKLGKTATESTDTELKEMLTGMLTYGASAQKYFDYKEDRLATADWYQVKLTAGVLDDGCKHGLYLNGDKVTITAPESDDNEKEFSHWTDSKGNIVATTATYELTVGTANEIYTPVYVSPSPLEFELSNDCTYYIVTGIGSWRGSELVIPASHKGLPVKSIGNSAFMYCYELTSITIPNSVTSIGEKAFSGCLRLVSITIGNSVTNIGDYAFESCYKLVDVINHSSLEFTPGADNYGYVAYYTKEVHDGPTKIVNQNGYLFYTYDNVNYLLDHVGDCTELILPESYNGQKYEIYKYAFAVHYNLTSITISNGVTRIGERAFDNRWHLTDVTIGNSVTSIGDCAFLNCGFTSITIPNSVTTIESGAFYGCDDLTSVVIPDSVLSIGNSVFAFCNGLKNVTIGNGMTSIPSYSFEGCNSLISIIIPNSIEKICETAFDECTELANVYYMGTAAEWASINIDFDGNSTGYSNLTNATHYYYSETQPTDTTQKYWHFVDGIPTIWESHTHSYTTDVIAPTATENGSITYTCACGDSYIETIIPVDFTITSSNRTMIGYIGSYNEYLHIPAVFQDNSTWYRVVRIDNNAFRACTKLYLVNIPDSVESIGDYAFAYCDKLVNVTGGNGIKCIGDYAFNSCYKLAWFSLKNVESIGSYAFAYCESINKITITNSVASIGKEAFNGCSNLTSIIFEDTSTWYRTNDINNWSSMTGGTSTSVTDASTNATYFKSTYWSYYWYKK